VSVVLFDRQIHDLDRLTKDMRSKSGKTMNRAEIIRALIDGLMRAAWNNAPPDPKPTSPALPNASVPAFHAGVVILSIPRISSIPFSNAAGR
jgi:hypothetical protein